MQIMKLVGNKKNICKNPKCFWQLLLLYHDQSNEKLKTGVARVTT